MKTSHRVNSFDALRLLAAWLVILGHGFILAGHPELVPRFGGLDAPVLGVAIFFTISGFLIWKSWFAASSWQDFVTARTLRIFPALIVVVVVTTFLLGPLVTTLSTPEYFQSGETYRYLVNAVIVDPQYTLPGVFQAQPFTTAVNGSLWTLRVELFCYVLVPVFGFLSKRIRPIVLAIAGVGLLVYGMSAPVILFDSNTTAAGLYIGFFMLGALVADAKWATQRSVLVPLALVAAWIALTALGLPIANVVGLACFAIALIKVASLNIPVVRRASRFGDLSYGTYLVAFPIQQVLLLVVPGLNVWAGIGAVIALSGVFAWILWNTVEARALAARFVVGAILKREKATPA